MPEPSPDVERIAYSLPEVAAMVGCTRQAVYKAIQRGEIRSFKLGDLRRIPADEVARLLAGGAE